jgi:hypothetical protein
MATKTKSIGTDGRDYSTIAAWEADLDSAAIYQAGDDAVGECYDDSPLDEHATIDGGGTIGLGSIRLTAAEGERHDGTAGTGARVVRSSAFAISVNTPVKTTVEDLELDLNGNEGAAVRILSQADVALQRSILHGVGGQSGNAGVLDFGHLDLQNCLIYSIARTADDPQGVYGVRDFYPATESRVHNLTVFRVQRQNGTGPAYGFYMQDQPTKAYRNLIAMDTGGTSTGQKKDFSQSAFAQATVDHNLSSDATASGEGSLTGKLSSNQFISTVEGSENLHLKSGADAIDAGVDLGTTPAGVNLDVDGYDRHAAGVPWDMGADESPPAVGGPYRTDAGRVWHAGAVAGQHHVAGPRAGKTFYAGPAAGQIHG